MQRIHLHFVRRRFGCRAWTIFVLAALTITARPKAADAHETDQFTMPADGGFADLGPDVTEWYYDVLSGGVDRANAAIADGLARHAPADEMAVLESPDDVVKAVDGMCLGGNPMVDSVEKALHSQWLQQRHPGQRIFFRRGYHNIYEHAFFILDYRILSRFFFGSTVKVFGIYIGTDKFAHFSAIGISYYWNYQKALRAGASEAEAMRAAVSFGTTGPMSEAGVMGTTSTGDYANGDLSANYSGFLFYRNLTEPVAVKGVMRPPLLVKAGPFWRPAPHVRVDSDWLRAFISDHWNEALNPGLFIPSMRPALVEAVRERTAVIFKFYGPADGSAPTPAYFRNKRLELSTYYGADYGHRGDDQSMVTIDNTCFGPLLATRDVQLPSGSQSDWVLDSQ